jgi:hypothetical protein
MIVIEKSNGIVSEQRCKILIENSPAIIWLTCFPLSLFYSSMNDSKNNFTVFGTIILCGQVN